MPNATTSQPLHVNYAALTPYTPYIASWSAEVTEPAVVIERRGWGIGYADETLYDRDDKKVLWLRAACRSGQGQPQFGKVHPLRQRRAMRRLLCNVCAEPADRTDEGVLWLLNDYRGDWPGWPEHMAVTEPPVCLPCAQRSARLCPALRRTGAVAVRVQDAPIAGVYGMRYRSDGVLPVPMEESTVTYDDPTVRWVKAAKLVRELLRCTIVEVEELYRG